MTFGQLTHVFPFQKKFSSMSKRSRSKAEKEEEEVKAVEPVAVADEDEIDDDAVEYLEVSSDGEDSADSFAAGPFLLGGQAPDFAAKAVIDGKISEDFVLSELVGSYTVVFFFPLAWTFVCPTEVCVCVF